MINVSSLPACISSMFFYHIFNEFLRTHGETLSVNMRRCKTSEDVLRVNTWHMNEFLGRWPFLKSCYITDDSILEFICEYSPCLALEMIKKEGRSELVIDSLEYSEDPYFAGLSVMIDQMLKIKKQIRDMGLQVSDGCAEQMFFRKLCYSAGGRIISPKLFCIPQSSNYLAQINDICPPFATLFEQKPNETRISCVFDN